MKTFNNKASADVLIKFPTRSRPRMFFETLELYYSMLSGKHNVQFLVSCDEDDSTMNNQEVRGRLEKLPNLTVFFGQNSTKIEAINADVAAVDSFDILLLASDDMLPILKNYDDIIVNGFKKHFPDTDGVLWFNDGRRRNRLNTLCILGQTYYHRFDYIYHPKYISFYCDDEFTQVAELLGKQVYDSRVIIRHDHYAYCEHIEFDELYVRNHEHVEVDKQLFNARKTKNFDLAL
jgi:hypothetical protein